MVLATSFSLPLCPARLKAGTVGTMGELRHWAKKIMEGQGEGVASISHVLLYGRDAGEKYRAAETVAKEMRKDRDGNFAFFAVPYAEGEKILLR